MNLAQDVLYRVHQVQAERRGQTALDYEEFTARLSSAYESDLSSLLAPGAATPVEIQFRDDARFELGWVCITPGAAKAIPSHEVLRAIKRHAAADWGALGNDDQMQNERALREGGRLISVYELADGCRFYVITDADHSVTTVLLPEDY